MAAPSVTYSFTNATTSDATQVNTNFTDLINGASDGTKDYTINSASLAGNLTVDGNVTLGSASGDVLTLNASVGSHITYGANATYDIGAATLAPRSLYIGDNTRSIRLLAGTITGSYTITLPPAVPTLTGKSMIFNTSATAEFRYPDKFTASKTSAYTATGDETIIPCAPAASFTVDLPAASTATGKKLTIVKTDSDATKVVTIDADGAETINGATTISITNQYEAVTIACDGTSWHITDKYAPVATQAQMETASQLDVPVTPGIAKYHPGTCKAWVRFEGISPSAIEASHNITSITDNGTGDTTITIATDFSGVNYCAVGMAGRNTAAVDGIVSIDKDSLPTAGTIRVLTSSGGGGLEDFIVVCVAMFGDQ